MCSGNERKQYMKRGFYFSLSFISIWHHKVSDQEELQEQTLKEVKAKAIFKPFSKLLNQIKTDHMLAMLPGAPMIM